MELANPTIEKERGKHCTKETIFTITHKHKPFTSRPRIINLHIVGAAQFTTVKSK